MFHFIFWSVVTICVLGPFVLLMWSAFHTLPTWVLIALIPVVVLAFIWDRKLSEKYPPPKPKCPFF